MSRGTCEPDLVFPRIAFAIFRNSPVYKYHAAGQAQDWPTQASIPSLARARKFTVKHTSSRPRKHLVRTHHTAPRAPTNNDDQPTLRQGAPRHQLRRPSHALRYAPTPLCPLFPSTSLTPAGTVWISSISILTVPAILHPTALASSTPSALLAQWNVAFTGGGRVAIPSALACLLANAVYAAALHRARQPRRALAHVGAGVCAAGIIPFTRFYMWPLVMELVGLVGRGDGLAAGDGARVEGLLRRWAGQNLARAVLPGIGALVAWAATWL